jgi:hypothetical protein
MYSTSSSLTPPSKEGPRQVRWAVTLLWVTAVQMAISLLVTLSRLSAEEGIPYALALFGVLPVLLVALIPRIAAGSNWARIAVVLFAAFGVLFDAPNFPAILARGGPMDALDLIGDATLVTAACLILTGPASNWFDRRRDV